MVRAVAASLVSIAVVLFTGCGEDAETTTPTGAAPDPPQVVTAVFRRTAVVSGSGVTEAGNTVGEVEAVGLTPEGEACVTIRIDPAYAPLDSSLGVAETTPGVG